MIFDAIVLSGGRSSRLNGYAKAGLRINGRTVLNLTLDALAEARHITVVGDTVGAEIPAGVRVTHEIPRFGGPVAGIAAGAYDLANVGAEPAAIVIVACDMPKISEALPALLASAPTTGAVIACDRDREQYLAGIVDGATLRAALRDLEVGNGTLRDLSVRQLWNATGWQTVAVPEGSTSDIDTWSDAQELGVDISTDRGTPADTYKERI